MPSVQTSVPQRTWMQYVDLRDRRFRLRLLTFRLAQNFKKRIDEIRFRERRFLQIVPRIQRLHDVAINRGGHRGRD